MKHAVTEAVKTKGRLRIATWNPDGSLGQEQIVDNLVVDAGLEALLHHLAEGSPTPAVLRINKIALGTGTNAPNAADTQLQTEVYRNNTASANVVGTVMTITGFFSAAEDNDTYREAGLFILGTASADTGTLFSRVAINITKSAIQTMTIEWTITMTAS